MIIVITPEEKVFNEAVIINQMFQEGLDLLHIRKPFSTEKEMEDFVHQIDEVYHCRLVLHSHYNLGMDYNISRFHFRENDRLNGLYAGYTGGNIISTSVHCINSYNALGEEWEYSFLSPVFPSISKKGYGQNTKVIEDIKHKKNLNVQLIALGGINEHNIRKVFDSGVDGVALLGAIWESDQPLNTLKKCRVNARL